MKIDGIGEHVGFVKPDIASDYDPVFVDGNEFIDVFGENKLMSEEEDSLTFFSGDDASRIAFTVTYHFLGKSFDAWELKHALFNAGIYDTDLVHYVSCYTRITALWFEFEGDFNGGFAALDRFITVAENFGLAYEYEARVDQEANGEPSDGDKLVYRSPQLSLGILSTDDVERLVRDFYIHCHSAREIRVTAPNGDIMLYGDYLDSLK